LGNYSKQTKLRALNPNEITPFDILIFDKKNNEKTENFKADIKYNLTDHKDKKLEIVANNSRLDMAGFFFVNGKIKNSGDIHSNNRNVISMVYDKIRSWLEYGRRKLSLTISPFSNGIIYNTNNRQTQSFRISSCTR
jgi:hypothetical protein